jgi:hypothetical protein
MTGGGGGGGAVGPHRHRCADASGPEPAFVQGCIEREAVAGPTVRHCGGELPFEANVEVPNLLASSDIVQL